MKNSKPTVLARTATSHGSKTASEMKGCVSIRVVAASFSMADVTDADISEGHNASITPAATISRIETTTRLRKAVGDMIANVKVRGWPREMRNEARNVDNTSNPKKKHAVGQSRLTAMLDEVKKQTTVKPQHTNLAPTLLKISTQYSKMSCQKHCR